nr:MAG TPA: hypothetical protein [Caudoviricetes sp.]
MKFFYDTLFIRRSREPLHTVHTPRNPCRFRSSQAPERRLKLLQIESFNYRVVHLKQVTHLLIGTLIR